MKKWTTLSLVLVLLLSLCGCQKQETMSSDYVATNVKNVEIRIEDVSPAGATVTIRDTNPEPHVYGEWYQVEKKEGSSWRFVEPIIEAFGFNDIGYIVDENGEVKFDIDWTWLYGELPTGTYRILKQAGGKSVAVCFEIK